MSDILGSVSSGLGTRLTSLADAIIDPMVAIITLAVFAILLPLIVQVLTVVQSTSQQLSSIQSSLVSTNPSVGATVTQGVPQVQGGSGITAGQYVWNPNPQGGGTYTWQTQ